MNQIAPVDDKPKRQLIEVVDPIPVLDTSRFEHMQRIASVMAQSTLIPESLYKEKDGVLPLTQIISNCFLVVNQSVRWGLDPFAVAQSVAVVRGKLCYEGKLVAAVLDAKLSVRLHATFTGDPTKSDYRIYLSDIPWTDDLIAQLRPGFTAPGMRVVDGSVADWQTGDKSPWAAAKNYRRMLIYRGTRDWARFYEPAVLLGVYTPDEMIDLADNARAERAREFAERPSLAERLAAARTDQIATTHQAEGFDPDFAAHEPQGLKPSQDAETEQPDALLSPSGSGSSGNETPPSQNPAAANTSASNGDEPEVEDASDEVDEAGHNDTAASASGDDHARIQLMRECIDNMIRAATDPDKSKREELVTKSYTAWLRELAADEPFVKRVFETCCRLIEDPSQVEVAKKHLSAKVA